jgi:predicted dehydrogenase
VLGANDRIQVGIIGVGGRGTYVSRQFANVGKQDGSCQIVAVCDVYQKRLSQAKTAHDCQGYLDYREVLNLPYIDAVIVATPDHWHAPVAIAAMRKGKDVYCEKPMCHTIDEAKQMAATVRETKRVMQVGSQTTSADQWHKAKKYIADGAIGKMLMSQGSYHRNSVEGEWNQDNAYHIDPAAGPTGKGEDFIDWKMWLGSAPERSYNADRFFRANTGTIPAASPPTSSSTWWRRSTSAGWSRSSRDASAPWAASGSSKTRARCRIRSI